MPAQSRNVILGAVWLGVLLAVHPLPHTGALRSLLLLVGLLHVGWLYWRRGRLPALPAGKTEAALLALLTGWLVLQSSLLAATPAVALAELGREWGKLLGLVALGIALPALLGSTSASDNREDRWLYTGLFLGFFSHALMVLGYQAWHLVANGRLLPGEGLVGNYGYVSLLVNFALALQLADAAERFCRGRSLLPLSDGGAWMAMAAVLLADALLTAKAGLVMTHALALVFLAAVLRQGTQHRRAAIVSVALGLTAVTVLTLALENRWSGALGSVASGIAASEPAADPSGSSRPVPSIESPIRPIDGNDPSFFFRSSWAWIGMQGIGHHPFGLGYGADAFGRYVAERFGKTGFVSSHSGWIDFTLANGIPATLLMLALAGWLLLRGWKAFRSGNVAGLALSLTAANYFGRCAMDGYMSGSRLTAFALMAAVLWALSVAPTGRDDAGSA